MSFADDEIVFSMAVSEKSPEETSFGNTSIITAIDEAETLKEELVTTLKETLKSLDLSRNMSKEFIDPTDVDGGESTSENKSDKKQNEANESSDTDDSYSIEIQVDTLSVIKKEVKDFQETLQTLREQLNDCQVLLDETKILVNKYPSGSSAMKNTESLSKDKKNEIIVIDGKEIMRQKRKQRKEKKIQKQKEKLKNKKEAKEEKKRLKEEKKREKKKMKLMKKRAIQREMKRLKVKKEAEKKKKKLEKEYQKKQKKKLKEEKKAMKQKKKLEKERGAKKQKKRVKFEKNC